MKYVFAILFVLLFTITEKSFASGKPPLCGMSFAQDYAKVMEQRYSEVFSSFLISSFKSAYASSGQKISDADVDFDRSFAFMTNVQFRCDTANEYHAPCEKVNAVDVNHISIAYLLAFPKAVVVKATSYPLDPWTLGSEFSFFQSGEATPVYDSLGKLKGYSCKAGYDKPGVIYVTYKNPETGVAVVQNNFYSEEGRGGLDRYIDTSYERFFPVEN